MIVSPRLTRAALAFLLFGAIAAFLPAQDTTALADNGCFTGPPGSTGQLAIAPTANTIQNAYRLVPATITYQIYFKPDAASAYGTVKSGEATTVFTLNSGRVFVNNKTYSGSNPTYTTAASFTAAQVVTYVGPITPYAGNMTATTTYVGGDPHNPGTNVTYTATANFTAL